MSFVRDQERRREMKIIFLIALSVLFIGIGFFIADMLVERPSLVVFFSGWFSCLSFFFFGGLFK